GEPGHAADGADHLPGDALRGDGGEEDAPADRGGRHRRDRRHRLRRAGEVPGQGHRDRRGRAGAVPDPGRLPRQDGEEGARAAVPGVHAGRAAVRPADDDQVVRVVRVRGGPPRGARHPPGGDDPPAVAGEDPDTVEQSPRISGSLFRPAVPGDRCAVMATLRPAQRRRLEAQLHLAQVARELLPKVAVPYLAHLRVETAGGERDLLLGLGTRTAGPVSIIDWQQAPLSAVFFECVEGDDYELPIEGGQTVAGKVLERNLVWFERGQLVKVMAADGVLLRERGSEEWRAEPAPGRVLWAGDAERRAVSPVDVELDAAQRRVVELPPERSALVLGEAGCGKTTVALHRLAWLKRRGKKRMRAAVIVPTDGLRRLIELLVQRMELEGVEVWRFDDWARHQARKAFRDLPRKESRSTPASVIALKRDPSMRAAIAEIAQRRAAKADEDAPVKRAPISAWANRDDPIHLYGDRDLMDRVARESIQQVRLAAVDEMIEHTKIQFSEPSELRLQHVDEDRRRAVDDRDLDEGTPEEDARSVDAEDYAVLFELDRLRAERRGKKPTIPRPYDLIVLDEAQELAPLELALVGRSVAKGGTLVVAGDAEQQVDPSACFQGWEATMRELSA